MPALSPTMEQGNIAKWHVKEGDSVVAGDNIADIETDKATMALEMQDDGVVAKILRPEGSKDIKVGEPVAILVEDAADIAAFADYSPGGGAAQPSGSKAPAKQPGQSRANCAKPSGGKGKGKGRAQPPSQNLPPHQVLEMPALSPTMEQGNLVEWKVKVGDQVAAGDLLAEVETDKATLGFETQEDGYVARLLVADGTKDIPIGVPVAIVVEDAGLVAAFENYSVQSGPGAGAGEMAGATEEDAVTQGSAAEGGSGAAYGGPRRDRLGPAARMALANAGLAVRDVTPSGPGGIVTKGDVLAAVAEGKRGGRKAAAAPNPGGPKAAPQVPAAGKGDPGNKSSEELSAVPPGSSAPRAEEGNAPGGPARTRPGLGPRYNDIPLTNMRRTIARRLLESKVTIPAVYVAADARLGELAKLRAVLKETGVKASVNDFVIKAVAKALRAVPGACVGWNAKAEEIIRFSAMDISIAVATDGGLITPMVKAADTKSVAQIAADVKDLAGRARANKLKPEDYTGGSFTVSNLGMFGVKEFSAIINLPQACILAVGGAQERSVVDGASGRLVAETFMTVTLTADNRAVDEETAAAFLKQFAFHIENPALLLA